MQSLLIEVDRSSGEVRRSIPDVGTKAHGLVVWRSLFVILDSENTSLVTFDPDTKERHVIWKVRRDRPRISTRRFLAAQLARRVGP